MLDEGALVVILLKAGSAAAALWMPICKLVDRQAVGSGIVSEGQ